MDFPSHVGGRSGTLRFTASHEQRLGEAHDLSCTLWECGFKLMVLVESLSRVDGQRIRKFKLEIDSGRDIGCESDEVQ